jgi:hypothetical protein
MGMYIRLEVGRRYFNIVSLEMLAEYHGLKTPKILDETIDMQTKIDLESLKDLGRTATIGNYLSAKEQFAEDAVER